MAVMTALLGWRGRRDLLYGIREQAGYCRRVLCPRLWKPDGSALNSSDLSLSP